MSMVMSEDRLRETDEASRALNAHNDRISRAIDAVAYRVIRGAVAIVAGGMLGMFGADWLL